MQQRYAPAASDKLALLRALALPLERQCPRRGAEIAYDGEVSQRPSHLQHNFVKIPRFPGFSTKIHLKTDFGGLPIAFQLTGGEASDSRNFEMLLDIGPDINPRAALRRQRLDSKSNREAARERGICPGIPHQRHSGILSETLYKGRARIEQAVGKLKRFKKIGNNNKEAVPPQPRSSNSYRKLPASAGGRRRRA